MPWRFQTIFRDDILQLLFRPIVLSLIHPSSPLNCGDARDVQGVQSIIGEHIFVPRPPLVHVLPKFLQARYDGDDRYLCLTNDLVEQLPVGCRTFLHPRCSHAIDKQAHSVQPSHQVVELVNCTTVGSSILFVFIKSSGIENSEMAVPDFEIVRVASFGASDNRRLSCVLPYEHINDGTFATSDLPKDDNIVNIVTWLKKKKMGN